MQKKIKFFVCSILVFTLLFDPALLCAQTSAPAPSQEPDQEVVVDTESSPDYDATTREGRARYWIEHQGEITFDIKNLYGEALEFATKQEQALGSDEVLQLIARNPKAMRVKKEGVGTAEFTFIDGFPVVRIIHEKTQMSFLMIDKMFFPSNSNHLEQYIARQHVDAGKSRTDGEHGRDTVVAWMEDHAIHSIEEHPRPNTTFARMRDYYRATWKATSPSDVVAGALFATAQAAITYGMMWTKQYLDPSGGPVNMISPAELSFAFGFTIAAINSTYRNIMDRGRSNWLEQKPDANWQYQGLSNYLNPKSGSSVIDQVKSYDWTAKEILSSKPARQAVISLAYSYSLLFMTSGHSQSITFSDWGGFLMGSWIFLKAQAKAIPSLFISNIGSTWWREPAFLKSEMRLNKGPVLDFEIFGRRYQSALSWNTVEGQARYLIPFAFKIPPLIINSVMNLPGAGAIPWVMQLISIAWGRWISVRTAEEMGVDPKTGETIKYVGEKTNAEKMRSEFENTWYMKYLIRPTINAADGAFGRNLCVLRLSGR